MSTFLPIEALSTLSVAAQAMVAAARGGPSVPTLGAAPTAGPSSAPDMSAAASFGRLVSAGISQINGKLVDSELGLQKLALGDVQNLHQLMIGLEESRLSFQVMMQARSRLLEAYQDIMKMPI